jgi:hypothetical protein
MTTLGFAREIEYFKQQIFEQGAKLPLNVCISAIKFEGGPLEFVGSIPLHRQFNQYGIPNMIMTRNRTKFHSHLAHIP